MCWNPGMLELGSCKARFPISHEYYGMDCFRGCDKKLSLVYRSYVIQSQLHLPLGWFLKGYQFYSHKKLTILT